MTDILLIPLEADRDLSLDEFAADLGQVLAARVTVGALPVPIREAYDTSRRQYHSGRILQMLLDTAPPGETKLLGVTSHDLFLPVLTYIFGQAQLAARACIFSSFRLRNDLYGLAPSTHLLRRRSFKEALHELGHTYGLRHCADEPCVMNASTYVEDIDIKPAEFCASCSAVIHGSGY